MTKVGIVSLFFIIKKGNYHNLWECSVTRTSVELYDMGERNGGRPAGEGAKTPCSTLEKFKSVKSAQVAVKWGQCLCSKGQCLT